MAKKSKIARNEQRKVIVNRYAAKRLELKKALVSPTSTDEEREAARLGLQKLPATPRRSAFAAATRSTVVPAVSSRSSASRVSASVTWRTGANCRALRSPAGKLPTVIRPTELALVAGTVPCKQLHPQRKGPRRTLNG